MADWRRSSVKPYVGAEEHADDVGLSGGDCGVARRMGIRRGVGEGRHDKARRPAIHQTS